MIDVDKYREILDTGLLLDHYFVLCNIKSGEKLNDNKRIQGFVNLLTKKEYIDPDGKLTEKAYDLIQGCELFEPKPEQIERINQFEVWVEEFHKKCSNKLKELTGSPQVKAKIENKSYSFLPNAVDFRKVLYKTINLYKLKDYSKIEETIMRHIEECHKSGKWYPLLQYYIMKNNASKMVTDMDDTGAEVNHTISPSADRVDPNDLF